MNNSPLLTDIENLVIALTKVSPIEEDFQWLKLKMSAVENWSEFENIIQVNRLESLIFKNLGIIKSEIDFPENLYKRYKSFYIHSLRRNLEKRKDILPILQIHRERNIPLNLLKGIPLSEFIYKDYGARSMSDLDVLVPVDKIQESKEIFLTNGWELVDHDSSHLPDHIHELRDTHNPYSFQKGGTKVELHDKIHSGLPSYHIPIKDLWERSKTYRFLNHEIFTFEDEDFLIHLCVHLHQHFVTTSVFMFKHFIDIEGFINSENTKIDWEVVNRRSIQYNCQEEVFNVIRMINEFFGTRVIIPTGLNENYPYFNLFMGYLRGETSQIEVFLESKANIHKAHLTNADTLQKKVIYIFALLFPNKNLIRLRYKKNKKSFIYHLYILRWIELVYNQIKHLIFPPKL